MDEVDSLITPREREVYLGLTDDADRQAFIQRFWQARDPYPETVRNEARERWEQRLQEARRRWRDPGDDRARVFLVNGEPSSSFQTRCAGAPVEVWTYEPRFQSKYLTMLVFTGGDTGPARLWHSGETPDLAAAAAGQCAADSQFTHAALWVRLIGRNSYDTVVKRALSPPRPKEWVSSFRPAAAAARPDRSMLPARLDVAFPGRYGDGLVRVFVAPGVATTPAPSGPGDMIVTGRILQGDETVDSFRYRFNALPTAGGVGAWPLAFERHLRPGRYKLQVELDAAETGGLFVGECELAVPDSAASIEAALQSDSSPSVVPVANTSNLVPPGESTAKPAAPAVAIAPAPQISPEVQRLFAEVDASLDAPRPGLHIVPPGASLLAGVQRFEARVDHAAGVPEDGQIERVSFSLDGRPVLTRNRPPFLAQLDLGHSPRPHRLTAEGLNRRGDLLASDELVLNAGAQRFAVKLVEPRPGVIYQRSLRAQVKVEAPTDRGVERVELYLGDSRVATLYQPPYVQPLVLPDRAATGFVRAVAYLSDGSSAEDLVLLNASAAADKMDIRLVELYTNVVDPAGKAVEGLGAREFQVFEDGVRQSIRQIERVRDAPLRLVTLIDNSASMQPRLEACREAGLEFLRRTLRPRDEASVITFNRVPRVVVGLTSDVGALEEGFSGLVAEEETSLWDSLIFSLYYLGGTTGQRAVLLLSDGLDRTSGFHFDDALESARRAGIAVYAIGINLPRGDAAQRLARLAAETGGRSFFLKGTGDLSRAYQEIERDLRTRYRIAYQSSNTRPNDAFRAVKVQVAGSGLEARTISGYYP
ncbi:MAG TPA: VWA domain-containing protein [Thermoanaerobaculia bacterium]|nr:VWA domain-containing protein [Thermoanaerobaculia bacterium]